MQGKRTMLHTFNLLANFYTGSSVLHEPEISVSKKVTETGASFKGEVLHQLEFHISIYMEQISPLQLLHLYTIQRKQFMTNKLPVKRIEVSNTSICIWRKIFSIVSIKIKLKRELIAVINLQKQVALHHKSQIIFLTIS